MTPSHTVSSPGWKHLFEVEDALVALWFLAFESLVIQLAGSPLTWVETPDGSGSVGMWVTLLGLAFVVFSRGSHDTSHDRAILRRIFLLGPVAFLLSAAVAIFSLLRGGSRSTRYLGGDEAEWAMPAAPDGLRRLAATPALLIGDSVFQGAFEEQRNSIMAAEALIWSDVVWVLFLFGLPYLIFIVGPRVAAGASGDWRAWTLRFALYAVALYSGHLLESHGFW
jgi:hypothetical protein